MPECRICLESNNQPMTSPCNCSGSAEHIHIECLQEYLLYYPDGVCRVCQTHMKFRNPMDIWIVFELFIGMLLLIEFSEVDVRVKIVSMLFVIGTLYFYYTYHLLDTFIVKLLSVLPVFLLLGGFDSDKGFGMTVVLVVFLSIAYIIQIIPFSHLLFVAVVAMVATYILSVSYVLLQFVGIWTNILMLSILVFGGYALVKAGR
jgi:hypothetical protein